MQSPASSLQSELLAWFDANKREMPWRERTDPYSIWVSEIMLQQTQVATVIPYWLRWMERFPTIEALAQANEQEVLSLWQGLGYYRRCRMLLEGARTVVTNGLPTTAEDWIKIPGVGRYTAGAIASITQNQSAPLVDGNVERVYARLSADASEAKALTKNTWLWAEQNVSDARPGDWNQALMELGATLCKPREADCPRCPISRHCSAFATKRQLEFPTPKAKQTVVSLQFDVWIPSYPTPKGIFIGVEQIPPGQWWEGMWRFPLADSLGEFENADLRRRLGAGELTWVGTHRHAVTHHRISLSAWLIQLETPHQELNFYTQAELETLPLPAAQRKLLTMASGWLTTRPDTIEP